MKKKQTLDKLDKQIEQLLRTNERFEILNDILRYLIKTHQGLISYSEIEKIIKNRKN